MDAEISAGSFGRCPAAGESSRGGGGAVLPHKRLMGMCCWMGLHFLNWSDYNGVANKKGSKMGRFSVKKVRKLLFIKFNNTLALTALHSAA